MCAEGKTFIDSYSHMLKRLQLLAVAAPQEIDKAFYNAPRKYAKVIGNIKTIIKKVLSTPNKSKLSPNNFKLYLLTELDKKLKTKETNLYDIKMLQKDKLAFNEYLKNIFTEKIKSLMQKEQAEWTKCCLVKDSKDGKLYPVEEFVFNVSKKRELYDHNKKITPYRINVHNTKAKGQRSSTLRGEKYLADGEYIEANRRMKEIGKGRRNIHADHFIPLALGGIHDVKNLRELSGRENVYKKDKLTKEGFNLLKKDIYNISHWHWKKFKGNKNKDIDTMQEILKTSVYRLRNKVIMMGYRKKFAFIQKVYPQYKDSQIRRIIKKHFTRDDN
jgi:hypothetical protein